MPIDMSPNAEGLPVIEFEVTVERDEDIFLNIVGTDVNTEKTVWEYFTDDPGTIDAFFEMTDKAKEEFERLIEEEEGGAAKDEESELLVVIKDTEYVGDDAEYAGEEGDK